jgi:hypothetical protein
MIEGNVFWLCESDGALLDMYGLKSVYGRRWDGQCPFIAKVGVAMVFGDRSTW